MIRLPIAVVLAIGLLTTGVSAQQTDDQSEEQRPPVFRTGTELVRVDVSVVDRGGNPVRTLTADDFELRENGQLQEITSFRLVEASGEPTDDLSLPIRSTHHAAAEAARDDVRVFLIFWDEYHIEQFSSAMRAREQLTRFVLEAFGPTDLVGIMDQLTPMSAVRFTRDRRALAEAVHVLKGRRGVYVPTRSAVEDAHLRHGQDVERIRAQVTATALRSAVMHLGTLRQGRKAVIFVGESLGRLGQDGPRVVSDLIRTANDNNTAIYTVDPRGLQATSSGVFAGMSSLLAALATATGAESIVSNDMSSALRRVVSHASAFYLIGYAPSHAEMDGKFREINVRVRQPGVQVRARNGYWAPRATEVERARALAMAAAMPSPVSAALRELAPDNSRRAADFWVGQAPGADDGVDLHVAWGPRPTTDERLAAAAVSLLAKNDTGTVYDGPVGDEGVTFVAAPGPLELDFTVHDEAGEVVDRELREVDVGDPGQTLLALTTPVLSRARNAAEFRALSEVPTPYAGREFSRTDRLLVRGFAYGAKAEGAEITAQLVGPRGATLAQLPVRRAGSQDGFLIDLPLTSLALGEFLIAIAARTPEDHVETYVPLRIRR
jgi:VWFA-related protein